MKTIGSLRMAIQAQTTQRERVAAQLAQARGSLRDAGAQLDQLDGYARHTAQAWATQGTLHSGARLLHQQSFMQRLGAAAQMQRGVVDTHEDRIAALTRELMLIDQRIAAWEGLLARKLKELQRMEQRREQRATDEAAAIRHVHRMGRDPGDTLGFAI